MSLNVKDLIFKTQILINLTYKFKKTLEKDLPTSRFSDTTLTTNKNPS